jgi:hypothetical protein
MTVALALLQGFVIVFLYGALSRSVRTLGNSRVDTRLLYAPCYDFLHLAVLKQRRADVRAAVSSRLPWRRGRPPRTAELTVGCRAALVTPFSIWRVLTGGPSMRSSCAPTMNSAHRLSVDAILCLGGRVYRCGLRMRRVPDRCLGCCTRSRRSGFGGPFEKSIHWRWPRQESSDLA